MCSKNAHTPSSNIVNKMMNSKAALELLHLEAILETATPSILHAFAGLLISYLAYRAACLQIVVSQINKHPSSSHIKSAPLLASQWPMP